jgi:hypothetical protein
LTFLVFKHKCFICFLCFCFLQFVSLLVHSCKSYIDHLDSS